MPQKGSETIVISLGGSLMVPNEVDTSFIREFTSLIQTYVEKGKRFFIITGGGRTCRHYQKALQDLGNTDADTLDWMGIYITRINAQLLRMTFGDMSYEDVVTDPTETITTDKPVIIGAGWKPGWSTDYDAVLVAEQLGAQTVLNLSNIEYVYDKDPNKYDNAQKFETLSWKEYRALLPESWDPGLHLPFDPIASKKAESLGLTVGVLNGRIENIKQYFNDESFIGTIIS